jgi:hypothetical protein
MRFYRLRFRQEGPTNYLAHFCILYSNKFSDVCLTYVRRYRQFRQFRSPFVWTLSGPCLDRVWTLSGPRLDLVWTSSGPRFGSDEITGNWNSHKAIVFFTCWEIEDSSHLFCRS